MTRTAAASMRTLLTHATLIDCVDPQPQADCAVLLQDGKIHDIFPAGSAPASATPRWST